NGCPESAEYALDRHLTLSVKFNSLIEMSPGYVFAEEDLPYGANELNSFTISLGRRVFFEDIVMIDEGIWDLSMLGRELMSVDALQQNALGGKTWRSSPIDSVILKKNGIYCKLKGLESNIDAGPHVIPEGMVRDFSENRVDCRSLDYYDHEIVIKTHELTRFIQSLDDEKPDDLKGEPSTSTKELNSHIIFARGLMEMAGIDPAKKGYTTAIKVAIETNGLSMSENTIRKMCKQVREATC
ncbi:hypothetical protein LRP52_31935, partial [Photobacterium sp. ZSDE20]|nr:hypothetical protein [Photobacterium sp. ZSDE20]